MFAEDLQTFTICDFASQSILSSAWSCCTFSQIIVSRTKQNVFIELILIKWSVGYWFKMIANGKVVGDGSWNLRVLVTDLQAERQLRVKSDLHIGGVMLRLVEDLGL